jgi:hypothetical protein
MMVDVLELQSSYSVYGIKSNRGVGDSTQGSLQKVDLHRLVRGSERQREDI